MKKVVFVGGTAYSGSTFLDMTLANAPDGFSCGEVYALFHPFRRRHLQLGCGCGDPLCTIWADLKSQGKERLYHAIFEKFPDVNVIVDSSKDPLWIHDRTVELEKEGIAVENVLIWKTPEEFFYSCLKRNRAKGWKRAWSNYHRLYFRLIKGWRAVRYSELCTSREVLTKLCDAVGITYFEGKERYWEKRHHTLFGNSSAKIHLYEKGSAAYEQKKIERDSQLHIANGGSDGSPHRAIYYRPPKWANGGYVNTSRSSSMGDIVQLLEATDVAGAHTGARKGCRDLTANIKASVRYELYRRAKQAVRSWLIRGYVGVA